MAKKQEPQPASPGKMTIMLIQLEGSDATLQQGIRTFQEAMGRAMPATVARPHLPANPLNSLAAPAVEANGDPQKGLFEDDGELVDDGNIIDAASTPAAPVAPSKPRSPAVFPKMQLDKNLDLRPAGKQHLKALMDEKQPKGQNEKIALCVYYLRQVLEVENVGPYQVFTCMDDVGIRVPNDLPKTIRNIAKANGWIDAANINALEIATKGINLVKHDLPHKGSA